MVCLCERDLSGNTKGTTSFHSVSAQGFGIASCIAGPWATRGLQIRLMECWAWWLSPSFHVQRYHSAAVTSVRWWWPWAAQAIQALAEHLCFRYVPAWSSKLVPPTLTHLSCSAALAHLQVVTAKYMESQCDCKEVWELGWNGGMWEKREGYGLERGVCGGMVKEMSGGLWVVRKGDARGDKNASLGLYWFRLFRVLGLSHKVFFHVISKYMGDGAFLSCLGLGIAKGCSWI